MGLLTRLIVRFRKPKFAIGDHVKIITRKPKQPYALERDPWLPFLNERPRIWGPFVVFERTSCVGRITFNPLRWTFQYVIPAPGFPSDYYFMNENELEVVVTVKDPPCKPAMIVGEGRSIVRVQG